MKYIVALALVLGCKDKAKEEAKPAPPTRADTCAAALVSFDRFVDIPDVKGEDWEKVKHALVDRCVADHWSDPALACMTAAGSSPATFKCWNEQLTKEQRDAANAALGGLGK
jgi:hypothetical protein